MKKLILALSVFMMFSFASTALAIPVGTFGEISHWATGASRLSGTGGEWDGIDPTDGLVGDDLTDGAIDLGSVTDDSFLIEFSDSIVNNVGDDFVIFQAIFRLDSVFVTENLHVSIGGTERFIRMSDYTDSGLDLILAGASPLPFSLFGAALDLSDWGFADGMSVSSFALTSYEETYSSHVMGIGNLSPGIGDLVSPSTNPVPEPSTVILLGSGLAGLVFLRRRQV